MVEHQIKKCPKCGQRLRVPAKIGGMLMACPSCKAKLHTDFKIGGVNKRDKCKGVELFELPSTIIEKILKYLKK